MTLAIESPCVDVCQIDSELRLCRGCFRTLDEIAAWARLSPEERRAIMQQLPERKTRTPDKT